MLTGRWFLSIYFWFGWLVLRKKQRRIPLLVDKEILSAHSNQEIRYKTRLLPVPIASCLRHHLVHLKFRWSPPKTLRPSWTPFRLRLVRPRYDFNLSFFKSHHLHFLGDPHQEHFDQDEFHPGWDQNDLSNFKDLSTSYICLLPAPSASCRRHHLPYLTSRWFPQRTLRPRWTPLRLWPVWRR